MAGPDSTLSVRIFPFVWLVALFLCGPSRMAEASGCHGSERPEFGLSTSRVGEANFPAEARPYRVGGYIRSDLPPPFPCVTCSESAGSTASPAVTDPTSSDPPRSLPSRSRPFGPRRISSPSGPAGTDPCKIGLPSQVSSNALPASLPPPESRPGRSTPRALPARTGPSQLPSSFPIRSIPNGPSRQPELRPAQPGSLRYHRGPRCLPASNR